MVMLKSLHWHWTPHSAGARAELLELRRDTLRLLLLLAAAGYTLWHLVTTAARPVEQSGQAYLVALVVVPVLVGTGLLLPRSHGAAVALFTGGLFVAISWALVMFESTQPAFLYAVLALVAAFVVHPLLGFAVVVAAVGMLASLASARSIGAMSHDVLQLAILGIVTVFGVWAVMRHLFIVLDWYVDSYDRAAQRTREAQEHRGQLVQALKQLDIAYYRLGMANAAKAMNDTLAM